MSVIRPSVWILLAATAVSGCGDDGSPDPMDSAVLCTVDADCDDGVYCNGLEMCDPGGVDSDERGCTPGADPCADMEVCREEDRSCLGCDVADDMDGDGVSAIACGGTDCDDDDPDRYPGNFEVCDPEGHDEDCDPMTFAGADGDDDGDGFVNAMCCQRTDTELVCGNDCDDSRSAVGPSTPEVCNGLDDDCDGDTDEGVLVEYFRDADGDGFGNGDAPTSSACSPPDGFVALVGDCDDGNAVRNPGLAEICDGFDNDCDGEADDGTLQTWYRDADGDGFGDDDEVTEACLRPDGYADRGADCDDAESLKNPISPEVCDGLDNNCNGAVDDGPIQTVLYRDADGDGFGNGDQRIIVCQPMSGYVGVAGDCDDTLATRSPAQLEICDEIDNDCDGVADDGLNRTYYRDADGDGFGVAGDSLTACSRPAGYAEALGDCDDSAELRRPGLPEVCDGVDNDCDGAIDDGATAVRWFRDADGDGFGLGSDFVESCTPVSGRVLMAGDCDDTDGSLNPGNPEVCDGVDNDCDGVPDDGVATTFYRDGDGDGFGVASETVQACTAPTGFVGAPGDCDDTSNRRSPALPELCDGVDNDCDTVVDDGVVVPTYYRDADGDGFGDPADSQMTCDAPSGYVLGNSDCDDTLASRNPSAPEVCDGIDNDCDTVVDDGVEQTFYRDADGDGFGTTNLAAPGATLRACALPAGYAAVTNDCDDSDGGRNPGAPEVCDDRDNDCNGLKDAPGEDPDADGFGAIGCGGSDCDNANANVFPGAMELCDGLDNDCDTLLDGPGEDQDGDRRASIACGGDDCDDTNASVFPGATERCDGIDNDCDSLFDGPGEDVDRDGFVSMACGGMDCDDTRNDVFPGAPELCDARDNDCNGALLADEDDDGDGVADTSCGGTDCDDTVATIYPGAPELCDGYDNDCNGALDFSGEDSDGDGVADVSCGSACTTGSCGDCDDTRADVFLGATELCDGVDNDCDGALDGPGEDDDGDGHADAVACGPTCTGECDDCDDTEPTVFGRLAGREPPPIPTDCDGVDNDCDGIADELDDLGRTTMWDAGLSYRNVDQTTLGDEIIVVGEDANRGSNDLAMAAARIDDGSVTLARTYLTSGLENETRPQVFALASSIGIVYISDAIGGVQQLHFMRVAPDGTLLSGPRLLVSTGYNVLQHQVALTSGSDLVVGWWDGMNVRHGVFSSSDGSVIRPGQVLPDAMGNFRLACDGPSTTCMVFSSMTTGGTGVVTLREDGSVLRPLTQVGTTGAQGTDIVSVGNRYVVSWWISYDEHARMREVFPTGLPGDPEVVITIPLGDPRHYIRLAASPTTVFLMQFSGIQGHDITSFAPATGAYSISAGFRASRGVFASGVNAISTTANGTTVGLGRAACY